MKRIFLTSAMAFAALSLFAQSSDTWHFYKKNGSEKHRKLIRNLLNRQVAGTAQKPTGIQQRVIAQASVSDVGLEDSATFVYSGTRSSRYNFNIQEPSYNWEFYSDFLPGPYFGSDSRSSDLMADSIKYYTDNEVSDISKAFYRADNKLDSFSSYSLGMPAITEKTLHSYNSSGKITQIVAVNDFGTPGIFDTSSMRKLWYNAAGTQLMKDTIYEQDINGLEPYYATRYHYDAQNNLDSIIELQNAGSTYDLNMVTAIQYDAGNRVRKVTSIEYDPFGTSTNIDTFGYTGTATVYTYYENSYTNDNFSDRYKIISFLGSNNLPDSLQSFTFDNGSFMPDAYARYYYNSYNNPDSLIAYEQDGTFQGRYNFYYETYDDGNNVGIKDAAAHKAFSVYPNPFGGVVNINWKNERTSAKINLINMVGQTVFSANKQLITGSNSLDVSGLSEGNYILMIQDEKGNIYNSKLSKK